MTGCLADLLEHLAPGRTVVALTGAGCSTSSGIGDYRDEQGAWKRSPPVQMHDFVHHDAARRRYWARSMLGWPLMARAQPNAAHHALAALEAAGVIHGLITQNVDGLHQRAGHRHVLELHGALAVVVCLRCGAAETRWGLQRRLEQANPFVLGAAATAAPDGDADLADSLDLSGFEVPVCQACGGIQKPDVVFYGDSVPRERVASAYALVEAADALLIVGSSLMVYSSFRFCRRANELGIPLLAINRGVTRADAWLRVKVEADCAVALAELEASVASRARG